MIGRLFARLWKSHSAERARKTKKNSDSEKEASETETERNRASQRGLFILSRPRNHNDRLHPK